MLRRNVNHLLQLFSSLTVCGSDHNNLYINVLPEIYHNRDTTFLVTPLPTLTPNFPLLFLSLSIRFRNRLLVFSWNCLTSFA